MRTMFITKNMTYPIWPQNVVALAGFLACAVLVGAAPIAYAQSKGSRTDEIVRSYCDSSGKFAVCIGRKAHECDGIVRPMVVKCESQISADASEAEQAQAFSDCFGMEFTGKYSKDIIYSPPCISHVYVPEAVQSPPPEFANTGGETVYPPGASPE